MGIVTDRSSPKKFHCNNCGGVRAHSELSRHIENSESGSEPHLWHLSDTYTLLRCDGCSTIHLRVVHWWSGAPDKEIVDNYPSITLRHKPEWLNEFNLLVDLPVALWSLLDELYKALNHAQPRLATMGIRAVLEIIMVAEVGDHGTIGKNVTKFIEAGYLPARYEELFRTTMIEAGHAAMHRAYSPKPDHLNILMDLTEWLLSALYLHPRKADEVGAQIPKRTIAVK